MTEVRRSYPLGGILSPHLWNKTQGYEGDVVVLISGKFLSTVCKIMQRALSQVQDWCVEVGLSVNPNKTTAILFTKNRNLNGFIKPTLFGSELELQN
jgi:hypothetical protein